MKNRDEIDLYSALGRMILAFQSLEATIIEIFTPLISSSSEQPGLIVAARRRFAELVDLTDALLQRHLSPEEKVQFTAILVEIRRLSKRRNLYVHSFYELVDFSTDTASYVRRRRSSQSGRIVIEESEVSVDEIMGLTEEMCAVSSKLYDFNRLLSDRGVLVRNYYPYVEE